MEMGSVAVDIEHVHGHSNRIVDEHHHNHSNRIVEEHHHHRHSRIVPVTCTPEQNPSTEVYSGWRNRTHFLTGSCTVAVVTSGRNGPITTGLETSRAFYLEVVMSFLFLFISRWVAFDAKKSDMFTRLVYCFGIGIGVGFNFFLSRTVTGVDGYSGAGVNPATCFGPAVVRGGHLWYRHWVFWIGPIIASICYYLYTRIIVLEGVRPKENKHDFINFLKACHSRAIHNK